VAALVGVDAILGVDSMDSIRRWAQQQVVIARQNMTVVLLILVAVLLGATAQILLKAGAIRLGAIPDVGTLLWRIATSPHILGGFLLYGVAGILWIVVLSRAPLSLAYPMLSLGYVVVLLASAFLFGEVIPALRLLGIAVIIVGLILLSSTA
jgi:multidrug transporter EmrE-like cation transporter